MNTNWEWTSINAHLRIQHRKRDTWQELEIWVMIDNVFFFTKIYFCLPYRECLAASFLAPPPSFGASLFADPPPLGWPPGALAPPLLPSPCRRHRRPRRRHQLRLKLHNDRELHIIIYTLWVGTIRVYLYMRQVIFPKWIDQLYVINASHI